MRSDLERGSPVLQLRHRKVVAIIVLGIYNCIADDVEGGLHSSATQLVDCVLLISPAIVEAQVDGFARKLNLAALGACNLICGDRGVAVALNPVQYLHQERASVAVGFAA